MDAGMEIVYWGYAFETLTSLTLHLCRNEVDFKLDLLCERSSYRSSQLCAFCDKFVWHLTDMMYVVLWLDLIIDNYSQPLKMYHVLWADKLLPPCSRKSTNNKPWWPLAYLANNQPHNHLKHNRHIKVWLSIIRQIKNRYIYTVKDFVVWHISSNQNSRIILKIC